MQYRPELDPVCSQLASRPARCVRSILLPLSAMSALCSRPALYCVQSILEMFGDNAFIDTAEVYGFGKSEEFLGEFMKVWGCEGVGLCGPEGRVRCSSENS